MFNYSQSCNCPVKSKNHNTKHDWNSNCCERSEQTYFRWASCGLTRMTANFEIVWMVCTYVCAWFWASQSFNVTYSEKHLIVPRAIKQNEWQTEPTLNKKFRRDNKSITIWLSLTTLDPQCCFMMRLENACKCHCNSRTNATTCTASKLEETADNIGIW